MGPIPNTPTSRSSRSSSPTSSGSPNSLTSSPSAASASTPIGPPPKRTYEFYGFALYLCSFVGFGIYLFWAFLPDAALNSLGISYYPNRYWALALPAWSCMSILFVLSVFTAVNLLRTPNLDSIYTVTDEQGILLPMLSSSTHLSSTESIPEIQDIPISVVNAILYGHLSTTASYSEEEEEILGESMNLSTTSYHNHVGVNGMGLGLPLGVMKGRIHHAYNEENEENQYPSSPTRKQSPTKHSQSHTQTVTYNINDTDPLVPNYRSLYANGTTLTHRYHLRIDTSSSQSSAGGTNSPTSVSLDGSDVDSERSS